VSGSEPQKIYFDESGFTGNNLLHSQQTWFSYASVATNDEEARDFAEYLINKYNIQNEELKGKNLVKFNRGRKAIDEVLERFKENIKVSVSNKKYALASKFFEYIFEPCISEKNLLFYHINFHIFIATILYMEFTARGAGAEEIFEEFEELIRSSEEPDLSNLFGSSVHQANSPILTQIREFAQSQVNSIREELSFLPGAGVGKWILDLTDTSLFSLLANWGTKHEVLTAVCDSAKPLQHDQEIYNIMIGRCDRHFSSVAGERQPITFNLSGPIQLVDSKQVHGVQLADVVAAACIYAINGGECAHADKWRSYLPEFAIYGSIVPDMENIDLNRLEVQRNAVVLLELHSRATNGTPLLEGMAEYIDLVSHALVYNPIPINA